MPKQDLIQGTSQDGTYLTLGKDTYALVECMHEYVICIPDTTTTGAVTSGTVATGVAGTRMASRGVAAGVSLFSRLSSGVLKGDITASVAAGVSCAITDTASVRLLLLQWRS